MAHFSGDTVRLQISLAAARLMVATLVVCGAMVFYWGWPRASRYVLPWRWRVGILYIGLGLIFWPPFYYYFGHLDLEMVWIPIWVATLLTFAIGMKRLAMANTYAPGGSLGHPYDLGWIMRPRAPRNPNPTAGELLQDSVESFIEDQSNPLAPFARWRRRHGPPPQDKREDPA